MADNNKILYIMENNMLDVSYSQTNRESVMDSRRNLNSPLGSCYNRAHHISGDGFVLDSQVTGAIGGHKMKLQQLPNMNDNQS
jgi:hypothetical protein